jgi:hypothetical protein
MGDAISHGPGTDNAYSLNLHKLLSWNPLLRRNGSAETPKSNTGSLAQGLGRIEFSGFESSSNFLENRNFLSEEDFL